MWSDILNKPKQDKAFSLFITELMNFLEDYDDEVEWINTNSHVLAEEDRNISISEVLSQIREKLANERDNPNIDHINKLDKLQQRRTNIQNTHR